MSAIDNEARSVPSELPFWSRKVTLVEVRDGVARFSNALSGKSAMLERRKGATLLLAWMGEWSTDVFAVREEDVARFYEQAQREHEKRTADRKASAALRKAERARYGRSA